MEKLNVAIADDNEKMVEVLSRIIDQDEDLKLVGKAHNGEEICNIIKEKAAGRGCSGYYHAQAGRAFCNGTVKS